MIARNGRSLCSGSQRYQQFHPNAPDTIGIVVWIEVSWQTQVADAQAVFDTGAGWSILNVDSAASLRLLGETGEETIAISTRLGTFMGELIRLGLTLPTDDGEVVSLEVPFLVCEDWYAPTFLGYQGLMDRLAFAVDPSDDTFHFGIAGEAP